MKWADYRERLGIGFNDDSKFEALKNRFANFGYSLSYSIYSKEDCRNLFIHVGAQWDCSYDSSYQVSNLFEKCTSLKDVVVNAVALYNSYEVNKQNNYYTRQKFKEDVLGFIKNSLNQLNIPYELISDEDGIFIFPKGVPEFDENLVSAPLSWLKMYPKTEKAWSEALRNYAELTDKPSIVADSFRKALEAFFQDFFKKPETSLDNFLNEYCEYLKYNGIPSEISDDFRKLLVAYTNFNNHFAKHQDKTSSNVLEYIMYATGNIMRLLITLKAQAERCGAGV